MWEVIRRRLRAFAVGSAVLIKGRPILIVEILVWCSFDATTHDETNVDSGRIFPYPKIKNIISPQVFRTIQALTYEFGIDAIVCCFAIRTTIGILYGNLAFLENQRRN